MATGLWVVLWALAACLMLLALALATPIVFLFDASFGARMRGRLRIRPLGGLIPAIPVFDSTKPAPPPGTRPEKKRRPRKRRHGRRPRPRMLAALPDLIGDLLATVHVEDLSLDLDVGTGDPADTGLLYGRLTPVLYGAWPRTAGHVEIRPDFTCARLDGTAAARVRFTPAAVLPPALRFAWAAFGPAR